MWTHLIIAANRTSKNNGMVKLPFKANHILIWIWFKLIASERIAYLFLLFFGEKAGSNSLIHLRIKYYNSR